MLLTGSPSAVSTTAHLDDIDRGLIDALLEDGRMSFRAMGQRVGLAGDAVRERYLRLVDTAVVRVVGVPDPTSLGYHTAAVLGIRVRGPIQPVANQLAKVPVMSLVTSTFGTYDILLEMIARDEQHLMQLIDKHVRSIPEVSGSTTLLYLNVLKWSPAVVTRALSKPLTAGTPPVVGADDRRLLVALQEDGRASYSELAERLDMNYQQVRRRMISLLETGTLKIMTTVNRVSLGLGMLAAICMRVEGPHLPDVARKLAAHPEIEVVIETIGRYDLMIEVTCRDLSQLRSLIDESIRPLTGIGSLETFVYSEIQRLPVQWGAHALTLALRTG